VVAYGWPKTMRRGTAQVSTVTQLQGVGCHISGNYFVSVDVSNAKGILHIDTSFESLQQLLSKFTKNKHK